MDTLQDIRDDVSKKSLKNCNEKVEYNTLRWNSFVIRFSYSFPYKIYTIKQVSISLYKNNIHLPKLIRTSTCFNSFYHSNNHFSTRVQQTSNPDDPISIHLSLHSMFPVTNLKTNKLQIEPKEKKISIILIYVRISHLYSLQLRSISSPFTLAPLIYHHSKCTPCRCTLPIETKRKK